MFSISAQLSITHQLGTRKGGGKANGEVNANGKGEKQCSAVSNGQLFKFVLSIHIRLACVQVISVSQAPVRDKGPRGAE